MQARSPRPAVFAAAIALWCGCTAAPPSPAPAAAAPIRFVDRMTAISESPMGSVGSAWTDVDGDGRVDVALANRGDSVSAQVFRQTESGFVNIPLRGSREGNAVAWGDADGDGDADLAFAASHAFELHETRLDGGTMTLEPAAERFGLADTTRNGAEGVAFGDVDADGDLDLFVARWGRRTVQILFRNRGGGAFAADTLVSPAPPVRAGNVHLVGLDRLPGRILVSAGGGAEPGRGSFTVDSLGAPRQLQGVAGGLGSSLGDVDGDLDLDLFIGSFLPSDTSALYLNEGGTLTRSGPDFTGVPTVIGSAFGDLDNDGDLDLVIATGYTDTGTVRVYGNTQGRLAPMTIPGLSDLSGPFGGVVLVDVDRDGRLDAFVASTLERNRLLMNTGGSGGWLQVALEGNAAWGARVTLEMSDGGRQLRTVHQQSGYGGHTEAVAHFGLGARSPRRVRIEWASGRTTDLDVSERNRRISARAP